MIFGKTKLIHDKLTLDSSSIHRELQTKEYDDYVLVKRECRAWNRDPYPWSAFTRRRWEVTRKVSSSILKTKYTSELIFPHRL